MVEISTLLAIKCYRTIYLLTELVPSVNSLGALLKGVRDLQLYSSMRQTYPPQRQSALLADLGGETQQMAAATLPGLIAK